VGAGEDPLHVAPSVLLDIDDLKSRADLVARLAGPEEQHEITHGDPGGMRLLQRAND